MRRLFGVVLLLAVAGTASAQQRWERNYGGTGLDLGICVRQTSDTGFVVAGETDSFGDSTQVYLLKTNASGVPLWTRTHGGTRIDFGRSVQQTSDGGYIITGGSTSFGNRDQVYLVKTNASGDTLWTRTYGGAGTDWGFPVQQTSDGGYIIAANATSFGNGVQVYLIKTNASGVPLWTRTHGGTGDDFARSVQQTSDGGYIIAGGSNSFGNGNQVYLIKTNASGDTLWTRNYGGTGGDFGMSVQQTSDGGYVIAGYTLSFGNGYQVYLIKTDANGSIGVEEENKGFEGPRVQGFKITPNPFTSFATLPGHEGERFTLYDVSGRMVGIFRGDRVGEGLAPGVYFLRSSDSQDKPLRIVKVR